MQARKDLLQLMLDAQLEDHEMLGQKTDEILLENVTDWRTKRGKSSLIIIKENPIARSSGITWDYNIFLTFLIIGLCIILITDSHSIKYKQKIY